MGLPETNEWSYTPTTQFVWAHIILSSLSLAVQKTGEGLVSCSCEHDVIEN